MSTMFIAVTFYLFYFSVCLRWIFTLENSWLWTNKNPPTSCFYLPSSEIKGIRYHTQILYGISNATC